MARPARWKDGAPAVGTVRTWLRNAEDEGVVRRAGTERTGRPGRPAHLWEITPAAAAADARKMSGRALAAERARVIRTGGAGVWLEALQAEILRRRA